MIDMCRMPSVSPDDSLGSRFHGNDMGNLAIWRCYICLPRDWQYTIVFAQRFVRKQYSWTVVQRVRCAVKSRKQHTIILQDVTMCASLDAPFNKYTLLAAFALPHHL